MEELIATGCKNPFGLFQGMTDSCPVFISMKNHFPCRTELRYIGIAGFHILISDPIMAKTTPGKFHQRRSTTTEPAMLAAMCPDVGSRTSTKSNHAAMMRSGYYLQPL
jgi:hypothetical protein